MSLPFFLSYARANHSPLVKRFFEDLSDTIRIASGLPYSQSVGFYEELEHQPASDWSSEAVEALQTSRTMVALLSPAYFHSEHGGKEWQIFEMRSRQCVKRREVKEEAPTSLVDVIIPITWIQWHGPVPRVVSEMLAYPDHIYQSHGVRQMLNSSGSYLAEYAELVKTVANEIMKKTAKSTLLPLESWHPMREVHSAFRLWDETPFKSDESRPTPKARELVFSDAQFPKTSGEHDQEAAGNRSEVGGPLSNPQNQSEKASVRRNQIEKYLVFVIDSNKQIRGLIEECCLISGHFEVKTYERPEEALRDLKLLSFHQKEPPDLIVLDLGKEMEHVKVLKELSEKRDTSSAIVAMSANLADSSLRHLMGATAIIPKPFNIDELMDHMKHNAKIGRDLRNYRKSSALDPGRRRPVFFSFSTQDKSPAAFLRRNLESSAFGVGYSDIGDNWRNNINGWISEAQVFVALITDSYIGSKNCLAELTNFNQRLKHPMSSSKLTLMPILYNSPDTDSDLLVHSCVNEHHFITMSDEDFINGFTALMGRIHNVLGDNQPHNGRDLRRFQKPNPKFYDLQIGRLND